MSGRRRADQELSFHGYVTGRRFPRDLRRVRRRAQFRAGAKSHSACRPRPCFPRPHRPRRRRSSPATGRPGSWLRRRNRAPAGSSPALLTEIPGSSNVLERGFVVYSNAAKQELLGVPAETLARLRRGQRARRRVAMAEGALRASRAEVAVSVTGVAGPDGGTAAKPVGLVHFACARRGRPTVAREERFGDIGREAVRLASVRVGLDLLEAAAG